MNLVNEAVKIPDWFVAEEWPDINGGGVVDIHQIQELERRWNKFEKGTNKGKAVKF